MIREMKEDEDESLTLPLLITSSVCLIPGKGPVLL